MVVIMPKRWQDIYYLKYVLRQDFYAYNYSHALSRVALRGVRRRARHKQKQQPIATFRRCQIGIHCLTGRKISGVDKTKRNTTRSTKTWAIAVAGL